MHEPEYLRQDECREDAACEKWILIDAVATGEAPNYQK